MIRTLIQLLKTGNVTQQSLFPDLPSYSRGLPCITGEPCSSGKGCSACVDVCPTEAIVLTPSTGRATIHLDLGRCIDCSECISVCPTGTITENRETKTAVRTRESLVLTNNAPEKNSHNLAIPPPGKSLFHNSLSIREVSTGDNASDLEAASANNPMFDVSRFGVHFSASPRFSDALLITGPAGRAMHEPLRRCYEAMAEPRIVIAAGASAISGGLHRGGYAHANGIDSILPVDVYIPGNPPHPWRIIYGILLAMGHPIIKSL